MFSFNSESFNIYLSQVSEIALVPQEEQKRLVALAQKGDRKARDKIVECNQKFVIKTARNYSEKWRVPIDDLIQAGNIGLLKAIEKFNTSVRVGFLTYARYWIFCEISDELKSNNSVKASKKGVKITSCDEETFAQLPSEEKNIDEQVITKIMAEEAFKHIRKLPQNSREVIEYRFGLFGKEKKSLEQIGRRFGKTREWIRQMESRTIRELQEQMAA